MSLKYLWKWPCQEFHVLGRSLYVLKSPFLMTISWMYVHCVYETTVIDWKVHSAEKGKSIFVPRANTVKYYLILYSLLISLIHHYAFLYTYFLTICFATVTFSLSFFVCFTCSYVIHLLFLQSDRYFQIIIFKFCHHALNSQCFMFCSCFMCHFTF